MSKPICFRCEDGIADILHNLSEDTKMPISLHVNMFLFEGMRNSDRIKEQIKELMSFKAMNQYKIKRRKFNEMRHEPENVLRKILNFSRSRFVMGLPVNMVQVNSLITEFEKAFKGFPEELQKEMQKDIEFISSLKHASALEEYISKTRRLYYGDKNVESRKKIVQRRTG